MKTVGVKFTNYWREYAFNTKLNLVEGVTYYIQTKETSYPTPVVVERYLKDKPRGFELKEIIDAVEADETDIERT